MSLLVRQGRVIDPANGVDAVQDLLIADGKIERLGKNLPTSRRESVAVRLREHDGEDRVVIEEPEEA